jgi:exodeoxyribonuclease V alpha subunit
LHPQPTQQFAESLSGLIERVTFFNEENGFAVLKVKAKGNRDQVTVIGSRSAALNELKLVWAKGRP